MASRAEAIGTGTAAARGLCPGKGTRYLVIGRWNDNGEYWCQGGSRTRKGAETIKARAEHDAANNPFAPGGAVFEIVEA